MAGKPLSREIDDVVAAGRTDERRIPSEPRRRQRAEPERGKRRIRAISSTRMSATARRACSSPTFAAAERAVVQSMSAKPKR